MYNKKSNNVEYKLHKNWILVHVMHKTAQNCETR